MYKFKNFLIIALLAIVITSSQAQTEEVRISIPSKADWTFDGKRVQVESSNTLIGQYVGDELSSGLENTFLGSGSGRKNSTGSQNTFLGMNTGYNGNGSRNVFIGYGAGEDEQRDDQLYISNKNTTTPLIYGDFREGRVKINDYLQVGKDLTVENDARIRSALEVLGSTSLYSLNITAPIPTLSLYAPSLGRFQFTYHPSQDRFFITDDDDKEVFEISNGQLSLPEYAGSNGGNIAIDGSGKLIKESANRMVYNRYEFHQKDNFDLYTKLTRGVQFADGTVLSGIKALIRDNNATGNSGVHNTAFVGIYRMDKLTGDENSILPIYRIDGGDTAMGVHEEFTQTSLGASGANIIDNSQYIYIIQVFYCIDCSVSEVEILE